MAFTNPFKRRRSGASNAAPAPAPPTRKKAAQPAGPAPASTTGTSASGTPTFQTAGQLNLVNYSHAELVKQVDDTLNQVQFGMTRSRRYMHGVGDVWANIAPWVLCLGTVGEVFAFLWISIATSTTTTIEQGKPVVHTITNDPAWWIIVSILATIVALEATFAVISFKSAAIRGDAEHRPGGPTDDDRKTIRTYRVFWALLAVFVSTGQIAFLVESTTQNFSVGATAFFIIVAIMRTTGTMVGDYYTAFAHKETPTTAEQAKAVTAERASIAAEMLHQKGQHVTILNNGSLGVMRAQSKGESEQDDLRTELTLKKMENQNRIDTMKAQAESAAMMSRMGSNFLRAIFDDQLPEEDRTRILTGLQGLLELNRKLPADYKIKELKEEEDV